MKKHLLSVVLLTYCVITFGQPPVTKNVATAGTLTFTPTELTTITELIVKGTIDARDFKSMGNLTSLQKLDLSAATIATYTGTGGTGGSSSQTYPAKCIPTRAFENAVNRDKIQSITFPDDLTSIGSYSCNNLKGLTNVVFGNQITKIESFAFSYCESLSSIDLKQNNLDISESAFTDCINLQSANLGNVVNLEKNAFAHCSKLTSVIFGNSLKSIGDFCFLDCKLLSISQLPNSLTTIGANVFQYNSKITTLSIGQNLSAINNVAFQYMEGLTSITVDNSNQSFASDNGILMNKAKTSIIFYPTLKEGSSFITPNNITSINDYAFFGCTNLTDIIFSPNISSIGNYAFSGCSNLNKLILLPTAPPSLGVDAFGVKTIANVHTSNVALDSYKGDNAWIKLGISSFQLIDITKTTPGGLKIAIKLKYPTVKFETINSLKVSGTINTDDLNEISTFTSINEVDLSGVTTFAESAIPANMFINSSSISRVTLPLGLKKIGNSAFSNCSNLNTITNLPTDSIGNYAFSNCKNLKINNLTFNNKLNYIGNNAFQNCSSIQGIIVIPDSISTINDSTFIGCTEISGSIFFNKKLKSIGKSAFEGVNKISKISLKQNIKEIKDNAFKGCIGINTINIENNTPPTIYQNTFYSVDKANTLLNISNGTTSLYKGNQFWNEFTLPHEDSGLNTVEVLVSVGLGGKVKINNVEYKDNEKATLTKTENINFEIIPDANKEVSSAIFGPTNITDRFWGTVYSGWGTVGANTPLTVTFKEKQILLTIKQITGEVKYLVNYGSEPEFTITSDAGWKISTVALNSSLLSSTGSNTYKLSPLTQPSVLRITYVANSMPSIANNLVKVYTSDNEIFVEGTENGEEIKLYSVNGIQLQSIISTGERIIIPINQKGTYLVKTSNATYKVVL